MRILFVCSSLEPGRDGVGDYTDRLSRELNRRGHKCFRLALNDRYVEPGDRFAANDEPEKEFVPRTLRLSSGRSWNMRSACVRAAVGGFAPHWVSLQYVPWGFEKRGLHFGLASALSSCCVGSRIHVMCHELWMEGRQFSLKHRLLGALQKTLIWRMFAVLSPQAVQTHLDCYRDMLGGIGVSATLLPLHGNIPPTASRAEGRKWLRARIGLDEDEQCLGFFGEIHNAIDYGKLAELIRRRRMHRRNLTILSAGQLTSRGKEAWREIVMKTSGAAQGLALGPLPAEQVSQYLHGLDVGLTSYPREYAGKSGGVAAMLEHGVPVCPLGYNTSKTESSADPQYVLPEEGSSVSATASHLLHTFSLATEVAGSGDSKQKVSL